MKRFLLLSTIPHDLSYVVDGWLHLQDKGDLWLSRHQCDFQGEGNGAGLPQRLGAKFGSFRTAVYMRETTFVVLLWVAVNASHRREPHRCIGVVYFVHYVKNVWSTLLNKYEEMGKKLLKYMLLAQGKIQISYLHVNKPKPYHCVNTPEVLKE